MTPQILSSRLAYDPLTGVLTWKCIPEVSQREIGWNKRYAGKPALNSLRKQGYLSGTLDGETIYAHRAAWAVHFGNWPNGEIDHADGVRHNNKLSNLLDKPHAENCKNAGPSKRGQYLPGVSFDAKQPNRPYRARVVLKKKTYGAGSFRTEQEAHASYLQKLEELGFTPRHGRM